MQNMCIYIYACIIHKKEYASIMPFIRPTHRQNMHESCSEIRLLLLIRK